MSGIYINTVNPMVKIGIHLSFFSILFGFEFVSLKTEQNFLNIHLMEIQ